MAELSQQKITPEEMDYVRKALSSGLINPSEVRIVLTLYKLTHLEEPPTLMNMVHLWQWAKHTVDLVVAGINNTGLITLDEEGR